MVTTHRRALVLAAFLFALVVIAVLWFAKRSDPTRPADSGAASKLSALVGERELDEPQFVDASLRTRAEIEMSSSASASGLESFAESSGVRLVVLSSGARSPVPRASVHVRADATHKLSIAASGSDWIGPDFEGFVKAGAREFHTDENGEIELPSPSHPTFVAARLEDQFGWTTLDSGDRGLVEVQLFHPHSILVRVRDRALVVQPGIDVAFSHSESSLAFWRAASDANGEARIPIVEVLTEAASIAAATPFSVSLCIPDSPRVEAWFTVNNLPTEPVELTLPPTGSVRVTLVDDDGRPVPLVGRLRLSPAKEGRDGRARLDQPGVTEEELVDGTALFARVGLGQHFDLDLKSTDDAVQLAKFIGPKVAGECVTLALPLPGDRTRVVGRLVDEGRAVIASAACELLSVVAHEREILSAHRSSFRTDAHGHFVWTMKRLIPGTTTPTSRLAYIRVLHGAASMPQATIHFANDFAEATLDLGDVVAVRTGPLVSGRVVDLRAAPVAGASIDVLLRNDTERETAPGFDTAFTAADGSFAILGPCSGVPLALEISGDTVLGRKVVPFECGSADICVKVDSAGSLEGTALVDHEAVVDGFVATFAPNDRVNAAPSKADWKRVGDRIFFEWHDLLPGFGTVRFDPGSSRGFAVVEVQGVLVSAGHVGRPQAIVDVDLRGKLPTRGAADDPEARVEFEVVDFRGRPIPCGVICGRSSGDGPYTFNRTFGNGRAYAAKSALAACSTLEFFGPGSAVTVLNAPFSSRTVTLAPEFEVEFRLVIPTRFSAAKLSVLGQITTGGGDPPPFRPAVFSRMQPFLFDEAGRGIVGLPMSGPFVVSAQLVRESGPGLPDVHYGMRFTRSDFTVRASDGRQVVVLTFDPESVERCTQKLGLR